MRTRANGSIPVDLICGARATAAIGLCAYVSVANANALPDRRRATGARIVDTSAGYTTVGSQNAVGYHYNSGHRLSLLTVGAYMQGWQGNGRPLSSRVHATQLSSLASITLTSFNVVPIRGKRTLSAAAQRARWASTE